MSAHESCGMMSSEPVQNDIWFIIERLKGWRYFNISIHDDNVRDTNAYRVDEHAYCVDENAFLDEGPCILYWWKRILLDEGRSLPDPMMKLIESQWWKWKCMMTPSLESKTCVRMSWDRHQWKCTSWIDATSQWIDATSQWIDVTSLLVTSQYIMSSWRSIWSDENAASRSWKWGVNIMKMKVWIWWKWITAVDSSWSHLDSSWSQCTVRL